MVISTCVAGKGADKGGSEGSPGVRAQCPLAKRAIVQSWSAPSRWLVSRTLPAYRAAFVGGNIAQGLNEHGSRGGVQARGGLVQDDDGWLRQHLNTNADALALATRHSTLDVVANARVCSLGRAVSVGGSETSRAGREAENRGRGSIERHEHAADRVGTPFPGRAAVSRQRRARASRGSHTQRAYAAEPHRSASPGRVGGWGLGALG